MGNSIKSFSTMIDTGWQFESETGMFLVKERGYEQL